MNKSTVLVEYKVDKTKLSKTEKAAQRIVNEQKKLGKSLKEIQHDAAKAFTTLADEQQEVAKHVARLAGEERELAAAIDEVAKAQRSANDEFDKVSRDVALAGDVESNVRTIGGAAGAFGFGGTAGRIGLGAEFLALVEALPRLKAALAGLPSAAKSAAESLGATGVGIGAALLGLALIAKQVSDDIDKANEQIRGAIDVNRQYAEVVAQGSAQAAQAAIEQAEQAQRVNDIEREGLEQALRTMETQIDNATGLEQLVIRIGDVVKTMPMEEVENRLKELDQEGENSAALIRRLNEALSDGTIPLDDLAKASENLGMSAQEAAQQTDSAAAEQERAHEEAARAAEQAGQRIQQAHQQYADAVENINRQTRQSIADARRKMKQSLKDLEKSLSEDLVKAVEEANRERIEAMRDYNRDEQKEARANQRELENIRKETLRSERDAIRNRDFLALAEIAERTKEEVADAKEGFMAERKEREIALKFALNDMKIAQNLERQERLKDYQKQRQDLRINLKRQISDIQRGANRQLENAARARDKQLQIAQQGANQLLNIEANLWRSRAQMANGSGGQFGGNSRGRGTGEQTLQVLRQIRVL